MNTIPPDRRDRDAFDEREWQAQERAMQTERRGADAHNDDPLVARYRVLARALRQTPMDAPPVDFAAVVARDVVGAPAREVSEGRLERVLMQTLVAALGLSGGTAIVLYGREWLASFAALLPGDTIQWTATIAVCIGASWALEQWHRHRAE